jgi:low temperature requirement protein LtrA
MIERYGLLNIIVLAETFVAITAMIQLEAGTVFPNPAFLWLAVLSAAIAFSLWGIYFTEDEHLADAELPHALLWGYGHFVLFAAGAATGAGMSVMLAVLNHSAHIDHQTGVLAIAIPVAIYLTTLWVIRDRLCLSGGARWLLLAVAALVLALGALAPAGVELIAVLLILAAVTRRRLANG